MEGYEYTTYSNTKTYSNFRVIKANNDVIVTPLGQSGNFVLSLTTNNFPGGRG